MAWPPPTGRRPCPAQPAGPGPRGGGRTLLGQHWVAGRGTGRRPCLAQPAWIHAANGDNMQYPMRLGYLPKRSCQKYGSPGDRALSLCHEQGWLHQPQYKFQLFDVVIKSPRYTGGDLMFLYRFVRRRRPQILVHAITFEQLFGFLSFLARLSALTCRLPD